MRVWVDMDGVWADFDAQYEHHFGSRPIRNDKGHDTDWDLVRSVPDFFATIPPMKDWLELHAGLTELVGCTWGIITGVPKEVDSADNHKRDWIKARFTPVPETICCASREKCLYAKPGDVLIDDYLKYRHLWENVGGIFIHHTSAARSIAKLRDLIAYKIFIPDRKAPQ